MTDSAADLIWTRRPTADRPLLGQTVLVVEDSRFACEALRLLCLRSGARIRRADSLRSAARHLSVYRPSVVVIDLGLPDGSGTTLLRDLARGQPRVPVLIAISGDEARRAEALSAGADDFLAKPLTSLMAFQAAVLAHLPPEARPAGPRPVAEVAVVPDPIALRDDLSHLAHLLSAAPDAPALDYAAQFLGGVAASARDEGLARAADALRAARDTGRERDAAIGEVARLLDARIARAAVV